MQTFQSVFERELRKILTSRIDELKDILANDGAVAEIADYRRITGQVAALRYAIDSFDEANKLATNAERGQ